MLGLLHDASSAGNLADFESTSSGELSIFGDRNIRANFLNVQEANSNFHSSTEADAGRDPFPVNTCREVAGKELISSHHDRFGVGKHHAARMFFSAFLHCALARVPVSSVHLRSTLSCVRFLSESEWAQLFDRAIASALGALSTVCNGTNTPSSRSCQIRTQRTSLMSRLVNNCTNSLCDDWHIMLNVKIHLRKLHHSDESCQSGSTARTACSMGYESNLIQNESGHMFCLSRTAMMKMYGSLSFSARISPSIYKLTEKPKGTLFFGGFPVPQQGLLCNTWIIGRIQKLQCPAIPAGAIRKCCPMYIGAYEQVDTAAALATSRTVAHMTSRFRDIENNVEANFRHQQRGLLSEISSESAQAPDKLSDTLWFKKQQQR